MLDIYWNILTMHGSINVKSPNNISEWQMRFNSAFKGLSGEGRYLITDVSGQPNGPNLEGQALLDY